MEKMSEHLPEPLRVGNSGHAWLDVRENKWICHIVTSLSHPATVHARHPMEAEDLANRLVDCFNFCAGLTAFEMSGSAKRLITGLENQNAKLQKELEEAKITIASRNVAIEALDSGLDAANARVKELERYAEHDEECPMHYANGSSIECTCGLSALLEKK